MNIKKITALTLAMTLSTAAVQIPVIGRDVPQSELEELKQQLQKEIDQYGEMDWYETVEEEVMELFDMADSNSQAKGEMSYVTTESCEIPQENVGAFHTEEYLPVKVKNFTKVSTDPRSTFSADVDTGSYCNMRRMVMSGYELSDISSGSVRTEEWLNYFDYEVNSRSDGKFSLQYETTVCPWNEDHQLLLMTVQANETDLENKGNNFVYLLDTSGSMDYAEKIALAKCSFKLLSYTLDEKDTVSIVTYSGDSYVALEGCRGNDYAAICNTLDSIVPYGGTNGSGGIEAAYRIANENYIEGGNNRVFIASDGDMNLGITDTAGLVDLITEEKETGVFLTVLGFGTGNYSDANMESIADAGNGNYFYIDCLDEAQHVLIESQKQTTLTVAKDVKFQAEFNPAQIAEYRLLGYENRDVADDDFKNDTVDGGEVGAGQQVTVLYELVPAAKVSESEILTLSINYKEPDQDTSKTEQYVVEAHEQENCSADMKLAISIAELSMLLHNDANRGSYAAQDIIDNAVAAAGNNTYRLQYAMLADELLME